MRTVEEAWEAIIGQVKRLPTEQVPLLQSAGRVLAETACAGTDCLPSTTRP